MKDIEIMDNENTLNNEICEAEGNEPAEKKKKDSTDDQNTKRCHINCLLIPDTCFFYGFALY